MDPPLDMQRMMVRSSYYRNNLLFSGPALMERLSQHENRRSRTVKVRQVSNT